MQLSLINTFIKAAVVPRDAAHTAGSLEEATSLLKQHPELTEATIHTAAVVGNSAAIERMIEADRELVRRKGGPYQWDPLTHLCFSRFLRLDKERSRQLIESAILLLKAGADPNTGFMEEGQYPGWEPVLYGAAGVAHHAGVTSVLLDFGADPNDNEVTYHAPEEYDFDAFKLIVESRKLNRSSLAAMLLRKVDWHHFEGVKLLLDHGADANEITIWKKTALQQAVLRDNELKTIEAMIAHGGNPKLKTESCPSALSLALHKGRGDVLTVFLSKDPSIKLDGSEKLLAACAMGDSDMVDQILQSRPAFLQEVIYYGAILLSNYAGNGNTKGVELLLKLGIGIDSLSSHGDTYFGLAPGSTALHAASWRGRHDTVRFLIEAGAGINVPDGYGRSPLELAVKACVDSYWTARRSPQSVASLLSAGAEVTQSLSNQLPTGYKEIDDLLIARGRN